MGIWALQPKGKLNLFPIFLAGAHACVSYKTLLIVNVACPFDRHFYMEMESLSLRPLKGIFACSNFSFIFCKGFFFFFLHLFFSSLPLPRAIWILLKHFSVVNSLKEGSCATCSQPVGRTLATTALKVRPGGATGDARGFIYFSFPLLTKLQHTLSLSIDAYLKDVVSLTHQLIRVNKPFACTVR